MSETGSHCKDTTSNESLDDSKSVVTDTTRNSGEHFTPKILYGIEGLGQNKDHDAMSPVWKAKMAPSIASTSMTSPLVPFQMVNRVKRQETSLSQTTKQESCSEPMSPSLLPQIDRWTESFSVIPRFMQKQHQKQPLESQSQSLLPQTDTRLADTTPWTSTKLSATEAPSPIKIHTGKTGKQPSKGQRKKKKVKDKSKSIMVPTQSSTKSATFSDVCDATEKISQRIEKQLADLEHVPRKKMLVIEAAVVHCVTSVQVSIENKLAKLKKSYSAENSDILKKLLQTLKTTLVRLIEHQRKEREQYAAATQASLSQLSQAETLIQKNQLLELGKRQKTVLSLLTKQRELAAKFKVVDNAYNEAKEVLPDKIDTSALIRMSSKEKNDVNNNELDQGTTADNPKTSSEKAEICKRSGSQVSDKDTIPCSGSSSATQHTNQESGSELLDFLKILGKRKRPKSVNDMAKSVDKLSSGSISQESSIYALADQDSLKGDITEVSGNVEYLQSNDIDSYEMTSMEEKDKDEKETKDRIENMKDQLEGHSDKEIMVFEDNKPDKEESAESLKIQQMDDSMKEVTVSGNVQDIDINKTLMADRTIEQQVSESENLTVEDCNMKEQYDSMKTNEEAVIAEKDTRGQGEATDKSKTDRSFDNDTLCKEKLTVDSIDKKISETVAKNNSFDFQNINEPLKHTITSLKVHKPSASSISSSIPETSLKRSLSDYDPSSGGIDPRTVYKQEARRTNEKTVSENLTDDDSPKAITTKAFYKQKSKDKKHGSIKDKRCVVDIDIVGCVTEKDDELLSQDVTTIPDTQETLTRESPVRHKKKAGSKRKRSASTDKTASSYKKYTKTSKENQAEEATIGKSDGVPKTKNEEVKKITSDSTETNIVPYESVHIFNERNVDNVLLNTGVNHVSSETVIDILNERETPSAVNDQKDMQNCFEDKSEVQLRGSAYRQILTEPNSTAFSEQLSTKVMKKETQTHIVLKTVDLAGKGLAASKQSDSVSLKSPGEKLDKVIKRIREEKEKKRKDNKVDNWSLAKNNNQASFKMPAIGKGMTIKEVRSDVTDNKNSIPSDITKVDVNFANLQQAGLAVGLGLPQSQATVQQAYSNSFPKGKDKSLMFSPPRQNPDEQYSDVSPTATSMSSDVFLVKAKELDRRMKLRAEMLQRMNTQNQTQRLNTKNGTNILPDQNVAFPINGEPMKKITKLALPVKTQNIGHSEENWMGKLPVTRKEKYKEIVENRKCFSAGVRLEKTEKTETSSEKLEAVIDDVIKSAAAFANEKENSLMSTIQKNDSSQKDQGSECTVCIASNILNKPTSCQVVKQTGLKTVGQSLKCVPSDVGTETAQMVDRQQNVLASTSYRDINLVSESISGNIFSGTVLYKPVLPTLKTLMQNGMVKAGNNVLSVMSKGKTYIASLTAQGFIRSMEGKIYKTLMQWLMDLEGDGTVVKRRKAYEMIFYNRHPLLAYCDNTGTSNIRKQTTDVLPTTSQNELNVEDISLWKDTNDGRLDKFLSTCHIRLLSKEDLIPCHDLPDNFWANDFAEVKIPSDVWECVETWD